jgi:CelD/BcsL family acetyltransferase involved in cellulose biosynthesis
LAKAARQNFRRQLNLLKKAMIVEQSVIRTPLDPEAELRTFKELHTTQWEAEGLPGHFNDWPNSTAFNQDLVTQLSKLGRLRMVHLRAEGRDLATQYAFTFGTNGYWRLAARATEKELSRFGLGVLGLMQLIEQMYSEGIRSLEGGYGRYPYKLQYGGEERAVVSMLLKSNRAASRVRTGTFLVIWDLVHLLYYRIWRLRIAPKLPFRRGPLWRRWIRLRT